LKDFLACTKIIPKGFDLSVSFVLTDFAIGLKTNDQANTISELFEILVKGQTLGRPIISSITAEVFQWRMSTFCKNHDFL